MTPEQIKDVEYDEFLNRLVVWRSDTEEIEKWMKRLEYLPSEKKQFIALCYADYEKRHPKESNVIETENEEHESND